MKVTLTNVKVYTQDKEGKPLKSKEGKPYTRLNIQCKEYGDKWLSGFGNSRNKNWQAGEEVDIEVKQNGEYLNFEMPKPVVGMAEEDRNMLTRIEMKLNEIHRILTTAPENQPMDEELPPMPF